MLAMHNQVTDSIPEVQMERQKGRLFFALLFLALVASSCSVLAAADQKSDAHTEEADAPVDVEDAEHVGAGSGSEDEDSDDEDEEYDDDEQACFSTAGIALFAHAIIDISSGGS